MSADLAPECGGDWGAGISGQLGTAPMEEPGGPLCRLLKRNPNFGFAKTYWQRICVFKNV